MNKLREQATELRNKGYSYKLINQKLGVSKSTMSYWFRDLPFEPNVIVRQRIKNNVLQAGLKAHQRRTEEIKELRQLGQREIGKMTNRDLLMVGIGMYMGEGAKTIEAIRITNADPHIISLSVKWLTECCGLGLENITIRLHIYPDTNEAEAINFWQGLTGVPIKNFRKTMIDLRLDKKRQHSGKLPYGTAHLSVVSNGDKEKGVRLYRKVNGWICGVTSQV